MRVVAGLLLCATLLPGCASAPPASTSNPTVAAPQRSPEEQRHRPSLDGQIAEAADALADQANLPAGARVAVVPLASPNGGTTSLGVLLAEKTAQRLLQQKRCQILDRTNLSAVMTERDLAYTDLADQKKAASTARLLAAEYLLTGTLVEAGNRIEVTFKLLEGETGGCVAMAGLKVPMTDDVRSMLVYVQRPRHGGGELPPLALRCDLLCRRGFQDVMLVDGSTVRSDDAFRIRLQSNSDCYAYVLLLDSLGKASVLFPHPRIPCGNAIKGGIEYLIPPADVPRDAQWYLFDSNPGTERFYILASYEPISGMDALLARLETAGADAGTALAGAERTYSKGMAPADKATLKGGFEVRQRGVNVALSPAGLSASAASPDRTMQVVQGVTSVSARVELKHER